MSCPRLNNLAELVERCPTVERHGHAERSVETGSIVADEAPMKLRVVNHDESALRATREHEDGTAAHVIAIEGSRHTSVDRHVGVGDERTASEIVGYRVRR